MANIYVRSSDGDNADNGSTWALAKATLAGAAAIDAAGDNIYLSQAHSESTPGAVTIALAGTNANPVKVVCVNDAAEPPTAVATTALVKSTTTGTMIIQGAAYFKGITFECSTGAVNGVFSVNGDVNGRIQIYEDCNLSNLATGAGAIINIGATGAANADPNKTILKNCGVKVSATGAAIVLFGELQWLGGSLLSGTAPTTVLFKPPTIRPALFYGDSLDFSNLNAACSLFLATSHGRWVIANSKLPASWTGSLISGSPVAAFRASMYNCDNADTNYRLWIEDYSGSIMSETTIVRTGGATDGTTPISWKMTTSANASEYVAPLISDPISVWNETTGSAKTITVEIVHDSVTALEDDEVWIEVTYLGTSGFPLGSVITDHRADILTPPDPQTSSSDTWTTTGLTNPNKQKLSVSITPQEKGFITARVFIGKASYTIYVDPEITVT